MTVANTTNLRLTTVEARDTVPEEITKDNFENLDAYVAATALTNGSGGGVIAGTVVVVGSADSTFNTTTTANNPKVCGVVQETIANAASGIVKHYGTTTLRVNGTTAVGDWLVTSSSAGIAAPVTQTNPPNGAFAIALTARTGAGTITALLLAVGITGSVSLPSSTNPTPTSEGALEWDSNDDRMAAGDGTGTKYFFPDNKGSNITAASTITIGSDAVYEVDGTTTITGGSSNPAGQRVYLLFNAATPMTHGTNWKLRGNISRVMVPGEVVTMLSLGSGVWKEISTGLVSPKVVTSNITYTSDNTLNDVTELQAELESGRVYRGEIMLIYEAHATPDFKWGLAFPSSIITLVKISATAITESSSFGTTTAYTSSEVGDGLGINRTVWVTFVMETSAAGTLKVQASQNTSSASATYLKKGSTLSVTRMA